MDTAAANKICFEKATGTVGAYVHGVGLHDVDSDAAGKLQRALHEFGVLFFDFGRPLERAEFETFATAFGELEQSKLSTGKGGTPYIDSDILPMKEYRVNCWHSDGTPFERPPQAAILMAVELPEAGGDTMWSSMYAAWDALSPSMQRMLEGLEVLHTTTRAPFVKEVSRTVHPAVIRDKITGRKILYVNSNYSEQFVGMHKSESDELLEMLFRHVNTPEFHVRLRWSLGKIAVWEQRVTQHRGVDDFVGPRKMQRLTFVGDKPSI